MDFSRYRDVEFEVKKSDSFEYSIEFWFQIHRYVSTEYSFVQTDLIWDFHSRVKLAHNVNQVTISCFPIVEASDLTKYGEKLEENMFYDQWNLVRCGVNFLTGKYFLNAIETDLDIQVQPVTSATTVPFKIVTPAGTRTNYGFLFVKDLRMFRQYNYKFIKTNRQIITPTLYPGLLHYYKNDFNYTINDNKTISYFMIDETDQARKHFLSVRFDWLSYNVVDDRYTPLTICPEAEYYDSILTSCQSE